MLIPLCEGIALTVFFVGLFDLVRKGTEYLRKRRLARATFDIALWTIVATVAMASTSLHAQKAKDGVPSDGVLIPYNPKDLLETGDDATRVYVPKETFLKLWAQAHPEAATGTEKPPADVLTGPVNYRLQSDGTHYTLRATFSLYVLTDEWTSRKLPFDGARLETVLLDGNPVGLFEKDGVPTISLKGQGIHTLELTLTGSVTSHLGRFLVATRLLDAPAASLQATLPQGAAVEESDRRLHSTVRNNQTLSQVDLGWQNNLRLSWTFPETSGQSSSQALSTSYSLLQLDIDGYVVTRTEKLRVNGQPLPFATYRIVGDWQISDVTAPNLSEWTLLEEEGERRLRVFFSQPTNAATLLVTGWSPLSNEPTQVASLGLIAAVRQESYFGLRHARLDRWQQNSLSGLERVSIRDLKRSFRIQENLSPDRIYRAFNAAENNNVSSEATDSTVRLSSEGVVFVGRNQVSIVVKSTFRIQGLGPFRQEISLPPNWRVQTAQGTTLRSWDVVESDQSRQLVLFYNRRTDSETEVIWRAQLDAPEFPLALPLLQTVTSDQTLDSDSIHWTLAASEDLKLLAEWCHRTHLCRR